MPGGGGTEQGPGETNQAMQTRKPWTTMTKQIGASVFFGVSSIAIITINKAVLTTFQFVL